MRIWLNPAFFMFALGVTGIAVSAFADSIGLGRPGFSLTQSAGLVMSLFVSMAGLVKLLSLDTQKLARILAGIYVGGIFYLGLRPSLETEYDRTLLSVRTFSREDFTINTAIFIVLGYLLMLSIGIRDIQQREGSLARRVIGVTVVGGLISLVLEVSQYCLIWGRYSQLMDLIANMLGTFLGATIYLFLYRLNTPPHTFAIDDR